MGYFHEESLEMSLRLIKNMLKVQEIVLANKLETNRIWKLSGLFEWIKVCHFRIEFWPSWIYLYNREGKHSRLEIIMPGKGEIRANKTRSHGKNRLSHLLPKEQELCLRLIVLECVIRILLCISVSYLYFYTLLTNNFVWKLKMRMKGYLVFGYHNIALWIKTIYIKYKDYGFWNQTNILAVWLRRCLFPKMG